HPRPRADHGKRGARRTGGTGQRTHRDRDRASARASGCPARRTHHPARRPTMNRAVRTSGSTFAPCDAGEWRAGLRRIGLFALALAALCPNLPRAAAADADLRTQDAARMIVVALPDRPEPVVEAGSTPRGYGGLPNYAGSQRSRAEATS